MSNTGKANKLVHSSSPYLKQHAYNPVDWHPWGSEALKKAKKEDKPIIISIGYSACHWCHVMERESFESEEIAQVMNENFICIKVDREERPDVDQLYMEAIQTMGINGGWPLNVFAMPDQRPFYGGTYFQPRQWMHILKSISDAFRDKRNELEDSAGAFAKSLSVSDSEKYGLVNDGFSANLEELIRTVNAFKGSFDRKEGGLSRAPKFPNPSIWRFLLTANSKIKDPEIHDQILLTLEKMASGGIYDQVGGGFARYSTDEKWFAPHFEKMLYDNAQLISIYSMGYQVMKQERFKEVVYETVEFVKRELTNSEYGFFSALDADSEGEEGNYYVWTEQELDEILGAESGIIKKYYNTRPEGNWERGLNILHTNQSVEKFAEAEGLHYKKLKTTIETAKKKLSAEREKRVRPGTDDKILTAWNAMMIKGLIDAYHAFGEPAFLDLAEKNASYILKNVFDGGKLLRTNSGSAAGIAGFLDDYAFSAEAFLALYQATFNTDYLDTAVNLADFMTEYFYDASEELFYYTDKNAEQLITRKKEIFDSVIPASNSVAALVLYQLGSLADRSDYTDIAENMIAKIAPMIRQEPQYLSNWAILYAFRSWPTVQLAIVGDAYRSFSEELMKPFIPNKVIAADNQSSELPLLKNRSAPKGRTSIYVCYNKTCKLPVYSVEEAFEQMDTNVH